MQCNYKESVNFLDKIGVGFAAISLGYNMALLGKCSEFKGCPLCGKIHTRDKYCSHKCTKMAQWGCEWKACKICGTRTSKPHTCSAKCRAEYKKNYDNAAYQKRKNVVCSNQRAYYQLVKDSPQYKARAKRAMNAHAKRIRESPKLRMESAIRARVMMSMKRRGTNKDGRTFELVGCTGAELAAHIERQFKRGMSWENYGCKWHVDHITPLSYFDMSNPDDQRRAWNWQNLRPFPAIQNIKEGNRRGECQTFLPLCN
jgi:hypothetical protein